MSVDQPDQSYRLFASLQAGLAATVVFGLALAYKLRPDLSRSATASFACIMLAALTVGYYLSIHQFLKRRWAKASTVVIMVLGAANIALAIAQTGGLDSPYLALWIAFIATLGVVGWWAPLGACGLTVLAYATALVLQPELLVTRLVQLVVILTAGGVAAGLAKRGLFHPRSPDSETTVQSQPLDIRLLMQSMGEGVLVVNPERQIQYFNQAAQRLTGWNEASAQRLDYRNVLKLQTPAGQAVADNIDPFLRAWQQRTTIVISDLTITTAGGRKFSTAMTVSPIYDRRGQISGGIALFRDISAEKAIERQRNEFVSTASHEMRTPIAAIEGYLALALNPTTATIDDRAKGYLQKAHDSIGHLGELFKNLLVITKIEDRSLADKLENVNLSELIQGAVEDMRMVAEKKGLQIELISGTQLVATSNPVMPIFMVRANPERLREVTMNLIENAIKYTPAGRIGVGVTGDADNVSVSVSDTGMGIPPDDLPHLFQKFYRVDNSATRTIGGTGLGLYISRTIVELYGGSIDVQSKVGEGSTFTFRLPRLKITAPLPVGAPGTIAQPQVATVAMDGVQAPS